jgi:hypothetical protein
MSWLAGLFRKGKEVSQTGVAPGSGAWVLD